MPKNAKRWWQRPRFVRGPGPQWFARLLRDIEREQAARAGAHGTPASATWLLRYRSRFRRVHDIFPATIHFYLKRCPESMKPIAIWLLGRCALRTEHLGLFECALAHPPPDVATPREALRRIEAWEKLRALAQLHPYEHQIAWYATAPVTKRNFRERLQNFAEHVDASHAAEAAGPSRMPLWFANLDWLRVPPKPAELIRRLLERIHRLVHGVD